MRYKERPLFFFFFTSCSVPSLLVHTQPHLNLAFEVSTERFTCVSGPEEEILSSPLHPHSGSMDFHTTSVSSTHVPSVLLIFIRTKETPTSALKTILCVGFFVFFSLRLRKLAWQQQQQHQRGMQPSAHTRPTNAPWSVFAGCRIGKGNAPSWMNKWTSEGAAVRSNCSDRFSTRPRRRGCLRGWFLSLVASQTRRNLVAAAIEVVLTTCVPFCHPRVC